MVEATQPYSIIKVTSSERSLERFIQAIAEPVELGEIKLLFTSLVEIENRWNPAIELAAGINQTFVRAFKASHNKSVLTKFEDALKSVNSFLELNQEKVAEPVHAALLLL